MLSDIVRRVGDAKLKDGCPRSLITYVESLLENVSTVVVHFGQLLATRKGLEREVRAAVAQQRWMGGAVDGVGESTLPHASMNSSRDSSAHGAVAGVDVFEARLAAVEADIADTKANHDK